MPALIPHWIDGGRRTGTGARRTPVYDPARGVATREVTLAEPPDVDAAVAAAVAASGRWRRTSLSERAEILFAARETLRAHRDDLAALVTAEHGKTLSDAAGEVTRGLENVAYACGIPQLLAGSHTEQVSTGIDVHSLRQPLGVVAAVTPFNFPVMVPLWMLANALACGNAVVLKPSEKDPSPSLLLAELLTRAGVPDGVVNVVQGDHVAVDRLLAHPEVAAVSFVGSTPVARHVYETGTRHAKRVQALGGAKNHLVVLPDADVDLAADAAVGAAYGSAGERCMAVSVVVAVGALADPLVEAVTDRLRRICVGPGTDPDVEMGPLITREHRDRVAQHLDDARTEGATVVVDGRPGFVDRPGFFLGPSLVDHVRPHMRVYREEIFGPVLSVVRVADFDEALDLVNANPYGNGTAIFTRDGGAARRYQHEVACGMVGVNVPIPVPVASYSFGGWKSSLFGDAHMYGPEGVRFFTRAKVVTTRWPDHAAGAVDLRFPAHGGADGLSPR